MNLREYLFRKDIKITEFSRQIGYERSYINKIVKGNYIPSKRLADTIEKATNGEVTSKELMEGK